MEPESWQRLREVRLAALAESPEMFCSNLDRELAFDEAEWRRRAARPATFVAGRETEADGLAGVFEFDGAWSLMSVWVAPSARGTGVIEALVDACQQHVLQAGANELGLGVIESNVRGIRAYTRLGFLATGERETLADGRTEIMMRKALA